MRLAELAQAVRVVEPAPTGCEVELRTVHLVIHLLGIAYGVCLIDLCKCLFWSIVGDGQRLALVCREVLEDPIFRIGRKACHHAEVVHAFRLEKQTVSRFLL